MPKKKSLTVRQLDAKIAAKKKASYTLRWKRMGDSFEAQGKHFHARISTSPSVQLQICVDKNKGDQWHVFPFKSAAAAKRGTPGILVNLLREHAQTRLAYRQRVYAEVLELRRDARRYAAAAKRS